MAQPREWAEVDLTVLLENPGLSDQVLARKLSGHTVEGIALVRDTLHTYHTEGQTAESAMWKSWKAKMIGAVPRLGQGHWTCARCGKKY